MSTAIVPGNNEGMIGSEAASIISKNSSSYYTLEGELRELVIERGCQQRGTEEICKMCARLALLEVSMCQQVRLANGTINTNE